MPAFLTRMTRSSMFLNGISNRIGATSERARFLGMVVGESLSSLVDKEGSKMNFGVHETSTEEARWWKGIPGIEDTVGSASGLLSSPELIVKKKQPTIQPKAKMTSVIQIIEEVKDDQEEEEDDDDLMPYAKPDSDPEDSEEDAADVVRKKDTAPV